jgi:hypothetical protein
LSIIFNNVPKGTEHTSLQYTFSKPSFYYLFFITITIILGIIIGIIPNAIINGT